MGDGDESKLRGASNIDKRAIPDAEIQAALERLLSDIEFRATERNRRFLRFVVEETLAGRSSRIKSYAIAVDVFGRGTDFDGATDPIVRIEATRLRAALNAYYSECGRADPIRITMPKGGYVPNFELAAPADEMPTARVDLPESKPQPERQIVPTRSTPVPWTHRLWSGRRHHFAIAVLIVCLGVAAIGFTKVLRDNAEHAMSLPPVVLVASQDGLSAGTAEGQITIGFSRSIGMSLSRFDGLSVISLSPSLTAPAALDKLGTSKFEHGAVYLLSSGVRIQASTLRFWWELKDANSGETVWSAAEDRSVSNGLTMPIEDEVANKIATTIGQPLGMITIRQLDVGHAHPTNGYNCVLRARAYFLAISETLHREIRDCLEQTVAVAPDYADAWVMLAWMYLDEDRNKFNVRTTAEDALNRGLSSAQRAAQLAPNSADAQEALMAIYYRKGDFDTAFAAGRHALELNPHNPDIEATLGDRLFVRGHWEEGAALVRSAFDRSLVISPTDRVTLVLDEYRKQNYKAALEEAQLIGLPNFYASPLLLAAIYGQIGNIPEAKRNIQALLAIRPHYATEMRDDLRARHYVEPLIDMLADGLRKAGLDLP
jgi:adenylate cyclase